MTQTYTDALPNARKIVEDAIGTSTEHTTNLKISGAYTFSSAIINVSAGIITLDLAVPDAPTSVAITESGGILTITWLAPVEVHGSAITAYNIYYGTSTGVLSLVDTVGDVLTTTYDTSDVWIINHFIAVSATNGVGESAQSSEASNSTATVYTSFDTTEVEYLTTDFTAHTSFNG